MVSLCSLVPFTSVRVQGFSFSLLTVPFGYSPSIPHFSSPPLNEFPSPSNSYPYYNVSLCHPHDPYCSPLFCLPQAILENSYNHLRDMSSNGGYMNYGSQVSDFKPTYVQVRGWDQNICCFDSCSVFLERTSFVL